MRTISAYRNKVGETGLFLFLCALFLGFRLLPLWTAVERLTYIDELDVGTLGMEFLKGMKLPFWAYQWDEYAGECLILGAASAGFFKIFGANLLALKMVPLLFSWGSFSLVFFFMRRYFSTGAAILCALFLIFCPPAFTQLSLLPMAGRTEPLLPGTLTLIVFYEFFYRRNLSRPWAILFGVVSGMAFWFYYANGIIILACLTAWIIQRPASLKSSALFVAIVGFLLGMAPGFIVMRNHPGFGVEFFTSSIFDYLGSVENLMRLPQKMLGLFLRDLPAAYVFYSAWGIPEKILSVLFFLLNALALARGLTGKSPGRALFLPLLLIPLLTLAALIFTVFDLGSIYGFVGVRYLSPLFFFASPLMAVVFDEVKWRNCFAAAWIGLSLLSHEGLCFKEVPGRANDYLGYSYQHLGGRGLSFLRLFVNTPDDFIKIMSRFDKDQRYFFYRGMSSFALDSGIETLLEDRSIPLVEVIPRIDPEAQVFFQEWIDEEIPKNFPRDPEAVERKTGMNALPFGFYGYPPDPQGMLQGNFRALPEKLNSGIYWGAGWKIREYFGEDRVRGLDWIKRFPVLFQDSAFQGFLACEQWYKIPFAM